MGDFQTHVSKCPERELNYIFSSFGHSQQKVLEGHICSGMGCLKDIMSEEQKTTTEGGIQ